MQLQWLLPVLEGQSTRALETGSVNIRPCRGWMCCLCCCYQFWEVSTIEGFLDLRTFDTTYTQPLSYTTTGHESIQDAGSRYTGSSVLLFPYFISISSLFLSFSLSASVREVLSGNKCPITDVRGTSKTVCGACSDATIGISLTSRVGGEGKKMIKGMDESAMRKVNDGHMSKCNVIFCEKKGSNGKQSIIGEQEKSK